MIPIRYDTFDKVHIPTYGCSEWCQNPLVTTLQKDTDWLVSESSGYNPTKGHRLTGVRTPWLQPYKGTQTDWCQNPLVTTLQRDTDWLVSEPPGYNPTQGHRLTGVRTPWLQPYKGTQTDWLVSESHSYNSTKGTQTDWCTIVPSNYQEEPYYIIHDYI